MTNDSETQMPPGNSANQDRAKSQYSTHSKVRSRKATGPKTISGKKRSKYNARRHGIFSKIVVLENESKLEYDMLLAALLDDRKPVGALETIVVEQIAMYLWRYRRFIRVEGAEIARGSNFVNWDNQVAMRLEDGHGEDIEKVEKEEGFYITRFEINSGLIEKIQNPIILSRCIEMLNVLKDQIAKDGFDKEHDHKMLEAIYGTHAAEQMHQNLLYSYKIWQRASEASEDEGTRQNFVEDIADEIHGLKEFERVQNIAEASKIELDQLRLNVPESHVSDRLVKFEANLVRFIDRALCQLERLQRIRLTVPAAAVR